MYYRKIRFSKPFLHQKTSTNIALGLRRYDTGVYRDTVVTIRYVSFTHVYRIAIHMIPIRSKLIH